MDSKKEWEQVPRVAAIHRTDSFKEGWKFYCPYCKKYHLHGFPLGHRVAHCTNPKSPYKKHGYILTDYTDENWFEKAGEETWEDINKRLSNEVNNGRK